MSQSGGTNNNNSRSQRKRKNVINYAMLDKNGHEESSSNIVLCPDVNKKVLDKENEKQVASPTKSDLLKKR